MLIDAPSTRAVAEVVDNGLDGRQGSVPVVAADEDAVFAESYNVRTAVSCDVTEEGQVAVEAPTFGVVAEVGECNVGVIEPRVAIVLGNKDSTVPKSNNVASPDASNVS